MKRKKLRKYLTLKRNFYLEYYNHLLHLLKEDLKNVGEETKKILIRRVKELENCLRKKHTKICLNCGSFDLKYRVNRNYKISICKRCGFSFFVPIKKG